MLIRYRLPPLSLVRRRARGERFLAPEQNARVVAGGRVFTKADLPLPAGPVTRTCLYCKWSDLS
jgi:hypothetical protein